MSSFALLSLLVTLAAIFGYLSHRVLRLPTSIGTTILSLTAAASIIAAGHLTPAVRSVAETVVSGIDFNRVVLHGMLALLLFAGALELDLEVLSREKLVVLSLSIFGTMLSTLVIGVVFRYVLLLLGMHLSWLGALLFGALISPTDPIAVLDMLRRVGAPASLRAQLAGESLFNDGVGAVIFLSLAGASSGGSLPSAGHFVLSLVVESLGAVLIGAVLGYLTFRLMRTVDSYKVEVLMTLALAMSGYALADALHLSAPIEAVTAGLLVNGRARPFAMSPKTRAHVETFWELIDDMLNVVLFLLLGLELLALPAAHHAFYAGLLAIPVVLFGRAISVGATVHTLRALSDAARGSVRILVWGGLRGALAIALALAIPASFGPERNLLLVTTYIVVVFSVIAQGLTIGPLLRHLGLHTRSSRHSAPLASAGSSGR